MSDSFEFNLHSPLTQEDWDKITDVEYENTASITLRTPQGRRVRYVKLEVLDKIRAEIEKAIWEDVVVTLDGTDETRIPRLDPDEVLEIIDKYKAEAR